MRAEEKTPVSVFCYVGIFQQKNIYSQNAPEKPDNKAFRHVENLFIQSVCFYSSRPAMG